MDVVLSFFNSLANKIPNSASITVIILQTILEAFDCHVTKYMHYWSCGANVQLNHSHIAEAGDTQTIKPKELKPIAVLSEKSKINTIAVFWMCIYQYFASWLQGTWSCLLELQTYQRRFHLTVEPEPCKAETKMLLATCTAQTYTLELLPKVLEIRKQLNPPK